MIKVTNNYEVEAYEKIFTKDVSDKRYEANAIFHRFLPHYYGYFTKEETGEFYIKLENLLIEKPHANILDMKIGTTSVTVNTLDFDI